MKLPSRDSLLDVEWLISAAEGEGLRGLVTDAAGVYGGAVTGVAEAVRDLTWPRGLRSVDLRHGLAHALTTGSWSTAPSGGRTLYSCSQWIWPAIRAERPDLWERIQARSVVPCVPPPLPDLATIRVAPPLDMAWVNPHYGIWGCGVSPDGRYVVTASRGREYDGGYLIVWNAEHGTKTAGVFESSEFRDCVVTRDGRHVISQYNHGTVAVRALPALALEATIEQLPAERARDYEATRSSHATGGSANRWRRFAVSADGERLAVASLQTVRIFTLEPFAIDGAVDGLSGLSHGILALDFIDADRLMIVARGEPMPVLVWDLNLRRMVDRRELEVPPIDGISRAVIAVDKQLMVAAGHTATVVWRLDQSSPVAMIASGITGQALAVSADGTLAATSGSVGNDPERAQGVKVEFVRLWSLPGLREIASWNLANLGCRDIVTGLAFSPDNRHLVLAGWEGVVRRLAIT